MRQKFVSRGKIFLLATAAVSALSSLLYAQAKSAQAKASATAVAGPYRALREIELRQAPGTKYPTVTRIPADITVNVVRAEGDWLRVESKRGGKPGYVDKRDVERWTER